MHEPNPKRQRLEVADEDIPLSQGDNHYIPLSQGDNTHPFECPLSQGSNAPTWTAVGSPRLMPDDTTAAHCSSALELARRGKNIHDRIHDHVALPALLVAVIDTPEFQRLRKLNQLGCTQFLFPSAVHTRFEHSIGVAHLAGKMVKHLQDEQPELDIDHRDVLCVMFAGLVHDLGHGPFSHTFEVFVNQYRKNEAAVQGTAYTPWHHEDNSVTMLRALVANNNIQLESYGLHPNYDLNFVEHLIHGIKPHAPWPENIGRPPAKRFLFDIVANKRNGIDVDKLDYFLRDAINCYGKPGIDCQISRLLSCSRVISAESEPQICFQEKVALSLEDIFLLRAKLHKYVYQHRTTKVAERMILDVFHAAQDHFFLRGKDNRRVSLAEAVDDTSAYSTMGDWILDAIEAAEDPQLHSAQVIIRKLRCRHLYPMIGYTQLLHPSSCATLSEDDIAKDLLSIIPRDKGIVASDIVVTTAKINYGSHDEYGNADNPVNHVNFFNPKMDDSSAFKLACNRVSSLFTPTCFEERTLFVFTRQPHMAKCIRQAFEVWKKKQEKSIAIPTPSMNFSPVRSPRDVIQRPTSLRPAALNRRFLGDELTLAPSSPPHPQ